MSDSHSISTVPRQVCEADVISRRAATPPPLLRTQGLWIHTLCAAAASRPKDLESSCCCQTNLPFPGREIAMFSWGWVRGLLQTHENHRYICSNDLWLFTWETTFCQLSLGNLGTTNTAHHPPQGWDPNKEAGMQATRYSKRFYLCAVCFLVLALPPCTRTPKHTRTCTQTHIHTHTLLSAHEAIKHTHP